MLKLSVLPALVLALTVHAYQAQSAGPCSDATVLSNSTIQVGPAQVRMSSFSCTSNPAPPPRAVSPDTSLARRTDDICGDVCTIVSCFGTGDVPAASDCAIIADAIDIMSADLGPTYELSATNGYYKQFTFGTCLTYIGVSAEVDTQACWSDWSRIIGQLLAACPGSPIGACTAAPPGLPVAAFSMEIRGLESF
ncbi:hypothetical protein B0H11DRAFT_2273546 [Mycena galericulata]|nr:hypothetical protein B0H11DRAFT_2273546 [Mycena galericulata]